MALKAKNFARSTLAEGINIGATSLKLQPGDVATFSGDGPFRAVLWSPLYSTPLEAPQVEIVELTWSAGSTFTCSKAQEGTGDYAWQQGTIVIQAATAGYWDQFGTTGDPQFARIGLGAAPSSSIRLNIYAGAGQRGIHVEGDDVEAIFADMAVGSNTTTIGIRGRGTNPAVDIAANEYALKLDVLNSGTALYVVRGNIRLNEVTPQDQPLYVAEAAAGKGAIKAVTTVGTGVWAESNGTGQAIYAFCTTSTAVRAVAVTGLAGHFSGGTNFSVWIEDLVRIQPGPLPSAGIMGRIGVDMAGKLQFDNGSAWKEVQFV